MNKKNVLSSQIILLNAITALTEHSRLLTSATYKFRQKKKISSHDGKGYDNASKEQELDWSNGKNKRRAREKNNSVSPFPKQQREITAVVVLMPDNGSIQQQIFHCPYLLSQCPLQFICGVRQHCKIQSILR